jgi:integrase
VRPVPICHEWNTHAYLNAYGAAPARPFIRAEIQRFLDYADDQVDRAVRARRKGALAAYRDAMIFNVIYGCSLRRTEAAKLDMVDFPPRRWNVLSVMGGGGGGRLRRECPAELRLRRPLRPVGDRAGWADQVRGDQRPVRGLPDVLKLPKELVLA